jgi:hypothetical protein
MNLSEIIVDDSFKTRKAVLVASLSSNPADAAPLEALAALYDAALEVSAERSGAFLKHAGQSVFVIFDASCGADAISAGADLLRKTIAPCAAAISYGDLAHFETADHGVDYLGAPLERAYALAKAANPGALFVDEAVILASAIGDVESALGKNAEVLLGVRGQYQLEGLERETVAYELLWSEARAGVRVQRSASDTAANLANANKWVTGVISSLGSKFGFIVDRAGVAHYFQSRNLAAGANLRRGSRVVFRALPPLRGAKEPRAEDVFVLESEVNGVISRINAAGWGFLKLHCENGLEHNLFMLGLTKGLAVGQSVRCRIGVNERGPMGYNAAPLETPAEPQLEAETANIPQAVQHAPPPRQRVRTTEAVAAD